MGPLTPVLSTYILSVRASSHPLPGASQYMALSLIDPVDKTKEKPNDGLGKEEEPKKLPKQVC